MTKDSDGITTRTLDDWVGPDFPATVRDVARAVGEGGFTVDDLRDSFVIAGWPFPVNPGSILGGMAARGELRVLCDEPARTPTSKGRRILRFVLVDDPPVEGGEGT